MFNETLQEFGVDAEQRQVNELKLQNFKSAEIAKRIGISERQVYRILEGLRERLMSIVSD